MARHIKAELFLEEAKKGRLYNDIRTLKDVEDALLYRGDGFDDYWDMCDVDLFSTVVYVRELRHRLESLNEGIEAEKKEEGGES